MHLPPGLRLFLPPGGGPSAGQLPAPGGVLGSRRTGRCHFIAFKIAHTTPQTHPPPPHLHPKTLKMHPATQAAADLGEYYVKIFFAVTCDSPPSANLTLDTLIFMPAASSNLPPQVVEVVEEVVE